MRYIVLKFIFLSLIILPLPSLANDGDGCVGHARRIQNAFGRLLGGSGDAADARRALPDSVARILDGVLLEMIMFDGLERPLIQVS